MAIPNSLPFSTNTVYGEYGTNTRTTKFGSGYDMISISQDLRGVNAYQLDDFGGFGQPDIPTPSISSKTDTSVTVGFNITRNKLDCLARIEYHQDNNEPPFSGSFTATSFITYTTDGAKTRTISGLTASTQYHFRVNYYNKFIDHVDDHATTADITTTTNSPPQFVAPMISSCSNDGFIDITANWNYDSSPSSFSAEYRINGGSWLQPANLISSSNWGSSTNPKSGTWRSQSAFNPGDTVEIRIRANAEGGNSASNWSSPCSS